MGGQLSGHCPSELFEMGLIAHLAVVCDTQNLQLLLRLQYRLDEVEPYDTGSPASYQKLKFLESKSDLPTVSPGFQAFECGIQVGCHGSFLP